MVEEEDSSASESEEEIIHRRKAMSTMGRVAVGAAAAAVIGGAAYYAGTRTAPQAPTADARTVTQTITAAQTVTTTLAAQTVTQTVARTETVTPAARTVTQTITAAGPGAPVKLATDRETLTVGLHIAGILTLDPHEAFEIWAIPPIANAYDNLLVYKFPDMGGSLPVVAESWQRSGDGLTWTFKIRDGIKFSNGDRLDAKAVEYSLKRIVSLKKQTTYWTNIIYLKDPNKIKALDSRTVQFTMDQKVARSTAIAAFSTFAFSVVNPKLAEANAKGGDWGNAWLKEHSAGSGPYVLESWERDNQVVLKVNENYWKEQPKIKKIIIKHVPEQTVQGLLLQKGDIDIAFGNGTAGLPVDVVDRLKGVEGVGISSKLSGHIRYIAMNVGNPKDTPLRDPRVRLAIRWAIDYDGIVNGILKGGGEVLQTLIPQVLGKFHLPSKPFSKNPEKAKQLLAEAGYPRGFDINLAVPAGVSPDVDIAALIQANLAEAEIRVKIIPEAAGEMYTKMRQQGQQMVVASWGGGFVDPDNYGTGHSCFDLKQIAWRNMYENEKQCKLAKEAVLEDDEARRVKLYHELQEDMLKETSSAVTHVDKYFVGRRTWLEGWEQPQIWSYSEFGRAYKEKVVT